MLNLNLDFLLFLLDLSFNSTSCESVHILCVYIYTQIFYLSKTGNTTMKKYWIFEILYE